MLFINKMKNLDEIEGNDYLFQNTKLAETIGIMSRKFAQNTGRTELFLS